VVGCGCRGRSLAAALVARGHAVRGTTRSEAALEPIEGSGAEATLADPGHLSTLVQGLEGVSLICWLMGTAQGPPEAVAALHGPRLQSMIEAIVDTPVRGVVYEGAGSVAPPLLEQGAETVRRAGRTYRMPVEVIEGDSTGHEGWLREAVTAVDRILSP
jgi:nucleoside-diphosphate-sugar epimerase